MSTSSSSSQSESKASRSPKSSHSDSTHTSASAQSSKHSSSSSHIELDDKKVRFSSESHSESHDAEHRPNMLSATLRKSSMRLDWTKQAVLEQDLEKLGQSARELDEQIVNFSEKDIQDNLKNIGTNLPPTLQTKQTNNRKKQQIQPNRP